MKLTQSTIFHTKTNRKEEIAEFIEQIIPNSENNPDYLEINTQDKQSIGIKQIKELISWMQMRPFQEENKLAVILEAEKMTTASQNSLLKVLEEPPAKSYLFLATNNPRSLLGTALSRANKITIGATSNGAVQQDIDLIPILSVDPKGQFSKIEEFTKIKDPKERKVQIRQFLEALHLHIRDSEGSKTENLNLIQQTQRALNANSNTKLVLESLFFNFKR